MGYLLQSWGTAPCELCAPDLVPVFLEVLPWGANQPKQDSFKLSLGNQDSYRYNRVGEGLLTGVQMDKGTSVEDGLLVAV